MTIIFVRSSLDAMSNASKPVAALIKELLALNRAETAATTVPSSATDVERRKSQRKKIRQELVRALAVRDR
jgi:hypothetical protein